MTATHKLPRLYIKNNNADDKTVSLDKDHAHYLMTVMRLQSGDEVRIFNENGEWRARLEGHKKAATLHILEKLRAAENRNTLITLAFTPLRKNRQDWLIEKAVELGADTFQPVITQNTQYKWDKPDRVMRQIIEATEQCERMRPPALKTAQTLESFISSAAAPIYTALERQSGVPSLPEALSDHQAGQPLVFLIGPEGGFTAPEVKLLEEKTVAYTLGDTILRSETAALKSLALADEILPR